MKKKDAAGLVRCESCGKKVADHKSVTLNDADLCNDCWDALKHDLKVAK